MRNLLLEQIIGRRWMLRSLMVHWSCWWHHWMRIKKAQEPLIVFNWW